GSCHRCRRTRPEAGRPFREANAPSLVIFGYFTPPTDEISTNVAAREPDPCHRPDSPPWPGFLGLSHYPPSPPAPSPSPAPSSIPPPGRRGDSTTPALTGGWRSAARSPPAARTAATPGHKLLRPHRPPPPSASRPGPRSPPVPPSATAPPPAAAWP